LRDNVISDILRVRDFPQIEAVQLWKQMIFGKNSNLVSREGTISTLKKLNHKKIVDWHESKILTAPATLCIIGDFDIDLALHYITKLFSAGRFLTKIAHRPIIVEPSLNCRNTTNRKLNQSIINLGGFCMSGSEIALRAPMCVISQIIGGDLSSRLFDILREQHGLAYSTDFDYDLLASTGYFDLFTIVDKECEKQAIELLYKLISDLRKDGVTSDEIQRSKNSILGQMRMDEESVTSSAIVLSSLFTLGFDYQFYLERENRIKNVTANDIKLILDEYFDPENLFLHILH
jgi:predicted Zn-dependent peptidase